jgi:carboxyl-terminal processing protease
MRNNFIKVAFYISLFGVAFASCQRDEVSTNTNPGFYKPDSTKVSAMSEIRQAAKFAYDILGDAYYWKDYASGINGLNSDTVKYPIADVNTIVETVPNDSDKWTSWLTTSSTTKAIRATDETETTFGYDLSLYIFSNNTSEVYGIVNYVYAGSPAANAGLKRGDIVLTINNSIITTSNYMELYNDASLKIGLGTFNSSTKSISESSKSVQLAATSMYKDPIVKDTVITTSGGTKVGYLLYTSYTLTSISSLEKIFENFQSQGIKDLVLDLRYNGGGYVTTAQALCSMIASSSVVNDILLKCQWNNTHQKELEDNPTGNDEDLYVRFASGVSYTDTYNKNQEVTLTHIGLNNLYVLTGQNTASASELTVTGLKPYISNVTLVGEPTYGKSFAGIIYDGSDYTSYGFNKINDWSLYAMVYKYADKNGSSPALMKSENYTYSNGSSANISYGMNPDIKAEDDQLDGYTLGNPNETLFAAAINTIDGTKTIKLLPARSSLLNAKMLHSGSTLKIDNNLIDNRIKKLPLK